MTEIKIYKRPWRAIRLILLSSVFVYLGLWGLTTGKMPLFISIITVSFFGLAYPVGFYNLFDRRPQIIINKIGIWDRNTNQDLIKWELIKDAYSINIYNQKFISLKLDKSFIMKKRQYKWATNLSKVVGAQKVNISLGQVNIDQGLLIDFIKEMSQTDLSERQVLIDKLADMQG